MTLRKWDELPEKMRNKEVRRYYNLLSANSVWLEVKRGFDVFVATILLIILAIPMIIIAVFIKNDSQGPILFKQKRVTQYGRVFTIYKFRTMVNNASKLGTQVTVSNDDRITDIGKILRKYRMDEFPQLFNILAGDMTFIGTRPEVIKYVNQYTPEMYATLLLPAGLTSRTSIAYKDEEKLLENAENVDEVYVKEILPAKMRYNLESLKRFGMVEDIKVMFETFVSVLK